MGTCVEQISHNSEAHYLLKKEDMDWRKFHETNGYDLWHGRLSMHCPNRIIRETIPFTKGMEKLLSY
jgi:hypothetical protein